MSQYGKRWSREESLLAFGVYCELPFGKLHSGNPRIIELAGRLGRTPSSVAMKACNFASLDPAQQARGIGGLTNASKTEREIWDEFFNDSEALVDKIEQVKIDRNIVEHDRSAAQDPGVPDEDVRLTRVRLRQRFFRSTVLSTYATKCALTRLDVPDLLVASHIIPWAVSPPRRCDPTNGLCLNALHDRAFDRGLISFDADLCLVASSRLLGGSDLGLLRDTLPLVGHRLTIPDRFQPDPVALEYHREQVFQP